MKNKKLQKLHTKRKDFRSKRIEIIIAGFLLAGLLTYFGIGYGNLNVDNNETAGANMTKQQPDIRPAISSLLRAFSDETHPDAEPTRSP